MKQTRNLSDDNLFGGLRVKIIVHARISSPAFFEEELLCDKNRCIVFIFRPAESAALARGEVPRQNHITNKSKQLFKHITERGREREREREKQRYQLEKDSLKRVMTLFYHSTLTLCLAVK